MSNRIIGVCAMGAADEAKLDVCNYKAMGSGNDGKSVPHLPSNADGYSIGMAFYDACKTKDSVTL